MEGLKMAEAVGCVGAGDGWALGGGVWWGVTSAEGAEDARERAGARARRW